MRYVMGIEGGENPTVVVADETGCLLGASQAGSTRPLKDAETEPDEAARRALLDAVHSAVKMADLENARIAACCLGLSGPQIARRALYVDCLPEGCSFVADAARLALHAVTLGQPGVAILADYAALTFGVNDSGQEASAGGWNLPAGDEGSERWLALRVWNACCRAQDGLAPPTQLLPMLLQHSGVADLRQLAGNAEARPLSETEASALAALAGRAAALGDPTARRLLRETGRELAHLVQATLKTLAMLRGPVTVGTVGGVFRTGRLTLRPFREAVKQVAPEAQIVGPRFSPAVAAVLLALEEIGLPPEASRLACLEASLPQFSAAR